MPRLIVNADDFGLTEGVNRAIGEAHQFGIVTSATLMANARAFEHAVELARRHPRLSVGCHVVLADGVPVSKTDDVPTLVTQRGAFRNSFGDFALAAVRGRISGEEIEREATTQIEKLQNAGLTVSHVDTHKHLHALPQVLGPLLRAAGVCGVRAVRNPFAPVKPLAYAHLLQRPRLWKRYSQVKTLRAMEGRFRRAVEAAGMLTTDGSFGVLGTGALEKKLFAAIIGSVPEGTWEFVTHPGYNDLDLDQVRTRLRDTRPVEHAVLMCAEAREAVEARGIELISYRELLPAQIESESRGAAGQS